MLGIFFLFLALVSFFLEFLSLRLETAMVSGITQQHDNIHYAFMGCWYMSIYIYIYIHTYI